ncbi:hypothetical protein F2Q70_00040099 [Brassica cretica]|uniref:Uncharacterized protein n=1 Tax=Brassica cretica TaxID=69181 RepID=A0A8S9K5G4_BRACR|nr:hypothetical protein F2Q70_00040099 [Brassica cretica]
MWEIKSLSRLAPTSVSPVGKPRVLVPDGVFQRGAALHKEYIVCSFLGKLPDYGPVQSVLNYMWEISLKGYSPHAVIKDHQVHSEPVLQDTSIQDKIVDHPLDPNPTIDSQTALDLITDSVPMLPPQVPPSSSTPLPVLSSHTELPTTPFDPSNLSSPHLKAPSSPISPTVPLVFSSQPSSASVVVSLAATRAPYSTSYIAIKQAAFFKSPPVSLPLSFMDTASPSWIATSNPALPSLSPISEIPTDDISSTSDPGESTTSGAPSTPSL